MKIDKINYPKINSIYENKINKNNKVLQQQIKDAEEKAKLAKEAAKKAAEAAKKAKK